MISDGVAELLTASFKKLPPQLIETIKITSCVGIQIYDSAICALHENMLLPFNIHDELRRAVAEGILEKAGPVYQFTHDLVQCTAYEMIPVDDRRAWHKKIGTSLLKSATNDPTMYLLATDQVNLFCKGGVPEIAKRTQFAKMNLAAAKFSVAASSFEQGKKM